MRRTLTLAPATGGKAATTRELKHGRKR